jgi:hypothetical protein
LLLNGQEIKPLDFAPVSFKNLLQPGKNVLVFAAGKKTGSLLPLKIVSQIDLCGLEGPVSLIPYVEKTLTLASE